MCFNVKLEREKGGKKVVYSHKGVRKYAVTPSFEIGTCSFRGPSLNVSSDVVDPEITINGQPTSRKKIRLSRFDTAKLRYNTRRTKIKTTLTVSRTS